MSKYHPYFAVWELTNECNFQCLHCYNGQPQVAKFDLNFAYNICDQLSNLGVKAVLLSGGEILLSGIWPQVALRLAELGMKPGLLSNGWLFDKDTVDKVVASKIDWIGFSLDGLESTHDSIRKKGSFKRIIDALSLLRENGLYTSINTTVNKRNISELPLLHSLLCENKVTAWQVQLAVPEGNLIDDPSSVMLDPAQIDTVIDFAHSIYRDSPVNIYLGDCIGHYNANEIEVRSFRSLPRFGISTYINGCGAGKITFGIKANGDVTGCISLSKKFFVEGNLYSRSLWDIWHNENSFEWNRKATKDSLRGFCAECQYASYCLSGCPSLKLDKDLNPIENIYCSYNHSIKEERKRILAIDDPALLASLGREAKGLGNYQIANEYFRRSLSLKYDELVNGEMVCND